MSFRCVRSCLNANLGGHDPLQEALAEASRLRTENEVQKRALTKITERAVDEQVLPIGRLEADLILARARIGTLEAELTEARARMTADPKDDIRIEIMLRNEAQARAEKAEAKVAELARENEVLREGLQAHWGERLEARLKYMLEQRRDPEQKV